MEWNVCGSEVIVSQQTEMNGGCLSCGVTAVVGSLERGEHTSSFGFPFLTLTPTCLPALDRLQANADATTSLSFIDKM